MYNEDLEEDNSDWNDQEGEDEDEDIDSDGKILLTTRISRSQISHNIFQDEADETAEKVEGADANEGEGKKVVNLGRQYF